MAKLVFDIETSALPLDRFDEAQQEYLFRECERIADEVARTARRTEISQQCSLWPFTAQVVCIAMLNAETSRGQVLFTAPEFEEDTGEAGPVEFVPCVDEVELLTAFWHVAKSPNTASATSKPPSSSTTSGANAFRGLNNMSPLHLK